MQTVATSRPNFLKLGGLLHSLSHYVTRAARFPLLMHGMTFRVFMESGAGGLGLFIYRNFRPTTRRYAGYRKVWVKYDNFKASVIVLKI